MADTVVTISANAAQIAEAKALLDPRQYRDGVRRAKNRTAQTLKTRISTRLREVVNIRKRDLDPFILLKKAGNDTDAVITVNRKAMSLRYYNPISTAAGVKVKIWKEKGPEVLRSTFKITSGQSPVYERELTGGPHTKRVGRYPLQQRFGPTGVGVLAGHPGMLESVVDEAADLYTKNLASQVDFIIRGAKSRAE